jgi:hypothetical protein
VAWDGDAKLQPCHIRDLDPCCVMNGKSVIVNRSSKIWHLTARCQMSDFKISNL